MSSNKTFTAVKIILSLALVAAVALAFSGIFFAMGDTYEHADQYTAGEAEITGTVKNLDIHWTSGKVTVGYHSGNTIELHEKAAKEISVDKQLRWWLDGDTLRVHYAKSGVHFFFGNMEKELALTLPEGIAFENADFHAASGHFDIPSLKAQQILLNVTSGDIDAAMDALKIDVEMTSGDLALKTGETSKDLSIRSTSGNVMVEAQELDSMKLRSTSGDILVTAEKIQDFSSESTSGTGHFTIKDSENAQIHSTSGEVQVQMEKFGTLKVDVTSGNVTAALSKEPGFTARLHTASGEVNYELPMSTKDSGYICGDGSGRVEIDTTSGDILLKAA